MTIVDVSRRRAVEAPEKTAFIHLASDSERASLTYRELDRRAASIAAWLTERGARNQRVMLVHPTGLDFIAAFCAAPTRPILRKSCRLMALHLQ